MLASALLCLWAVISAGAASAQDVMAPGAQVFKQHCATCHDSAAPRIPPQPALRELTSAKISQTLETGVMKQQGSTLTDSERLAVVQWLGRKTAIGVKPGQLLNSCKTATPSDIGDKLPSWRSWGGGLENWRFQTREAAGLTASDLPRLKLKWALVLLCYK